MDNHAKANERAIAQSRGLHADPALAQLHSLQDGLEPELLTCIGHRRSIPLT
jgi:hypothetical protein